METSRIIRVGACNYVIPGTYCCCITRTYTGMHNTQSNTTRRRDGFSVGIEIDLVVLWVVEIDVISVWGSGVDLFSVWGSELSWFCVGVENDFV